MRNLKTTIILLLVGAVTGVAQAPRPGQTTTTTSGASFTKNGEMDYTVRDANGNTLSNVMDLKYLSTETLSVLDKNSGTIYLLNDFNTKPVGSTGTAAILATNISKNFYITNPNSFANYVNETYVSGGAFVNIGGSYVYYNNDDNSTYYLDGIRNFSNWGAKNTTKLPYSATNSYWGRDASNDTYHLVIKGESPDYTGYTTEKSGNDMIVKINGVKTYKLPGYYTTASFVYKPLETVASSTSVTNTTTGEGCVSGNCKDGWGKYQYNGGYYDGFWVNGKKDGYGLYKWVGTGKYIGSWKKDQMQGYGVYIADNEDNIAGWYANGQLNGVGYTVTGNVWEQGIYTNGNLTTSYSFVATGNDSGCTAGDCENKYGRFNWDNGDSFTGFWKNGSMYLGTYTFASGDKYSGTFNKENQFDGFGRYFYEDGGYYGGEWLNGTYEGKGYYHDKEFKKQIGMWKNRALVKNLE